MDLRTKSGILSVIVARPLLSMVLNLELQTVIGLLMSDLDALVTIDNRLGTIGCGFCLDLIWSVCVCCAVCVCMVFTSVQMCQQSSIIFKFIFKTESLLSNWDIQWIEGSVCSHSPTTGVTDVWGLSGFYMGAEDLNSDSGHYACNNHFTHWTCSPDSEIFLCMVQLLLVCCLPNSFIIFITKSKWLTH